MSNIKERHLFPGGNTSKGFYSFYRYIIAQETANRIICLKGGPGTGKSSFMKKLGNHFLSLGYTVEYHHCSSDNNSLDGLVIKELKVAVLDGTSPHIVDPVNPGAVDEILNLGVALDTSKLANNKTQIISINKEIGRSFKRAYRYFGAARCIHEDWSTLNSEALNTYKVEELVKELKDKILTGGKPFFALNRHLFGTAFTPNGIVSFNEDLAKECSSLYCIKGGPGTSKTEILKRVASTLEKNGYFVEYLHDPLIPERIENIIIPELSTGIFTTNEISSISYENATTYNMIDLCYKSSLNSRLDSILYDKNEFNTLINKGLECIRHSKALHDELETYYIGAMDFSVVDKAYDEVVKKLESYI